MDELDQVFARLRELVESIPDPTGLRHEFVNAACRKAAEMLQVHVEAIEAAEWASIVKHLDR